MDRRDTHADIGHAEAKSQALGPYVVENGKQYRMPYGIVRKATFSNLKQAEMIDIPHAARLQYRLMLLGAVIKPAVDFARAQITIIYNPDASENASEKTSLGELVKMLSKEGVHTDSASTSDTDYDYYKELYTNSHNPKAIKESPPYSYTAKEWSKMKPRWQEKMAEVEVRKREKFRRWQESYLNSKPGIAQKIAEEHNNRNAEKAVPPN